MWRIAALAVLALPVSVRAQQAADMFSCIEPARLSPRTLEYRIGVYADRWTVAPVTAGDRRLVRVTKRRTRDGSTAVEHTIDLDATSLVPIAFRVMSATSGLMSDLVVKGDRLTGQWQRTEVSVATGGRPVLIGAGVDNVLVAAVDWDRCAAVTVPAFDVDGTPSVARFTRVGERVLMISGREVAVHEILREGELSQTRLFVTKSAPFLLARTESVPERNTRMELVALPR